MVADRKEVKLTRLEKIKSKHAVTGIVGLGYVGLPLAIAFCWHTGVAILTLGTKADITFIELAKAI